MGVSAPPPPSCGSGTEVSTNEQLLTAPISDRHSGARGLPVGPKAAPQISTRQTKGACVTFPDRLIAVWASSVADMADISFHE
jgi:hypothetical protein